MDHVDSNGAVAVSPPDRTDDRATVLVVDDEPQVRRMFLAALAHGRFRGLEAADVDEARHLLATHRVDLVLLDRTMPGVGGEQLLRELRQDPRTERVSVVVVSGDGELDAKVETLAAGANDYLVKPVSLEELLARVRAQLGDRERWQRHLDDRLALRSELSRLLAEIEPEQPLPLLETAVHRVLGQDLPVLRLALEHLEITGDGPAVETLRILPLPEDPTGPGAIVRMPLRAGSSTSGTLHLEVRDQVDHTLSTLMDLAPQLASLTLRSLRTRRATQEATERVQQIVADGDLRGVFQPVVDLRDGTAVGYEGLARFADGTAPAPMFAWATRSGVGAELERAAMTRLLDDARRLPSDRWVSLNVSAVTLQCTDLAPLLGEADRSVVLEITEHEAIEDYARLRQAVTDLPSIRLAVDDAGAGHASLRHIYELRPDVIKLDRSWVDHLDQDPVRRALVDGMVGFAAAMSADIIGEGVEREAEASTLRALGVRYAQGYHLGRPVPVAEVSR